MTTQVNTYGFTDKNISLAPQEHGVYSLFKNGEVIYYGRAAGRGVTIASRLVSHKSGNEGPCTAAADTYAREVSTSPEKRERQLLQAHLDRYGRLPKCNDRMP